MSQELFHYHHYKNLLQLFLFEQIIPDLRQKFFFQFSYGNEHLPHSPFYELRNQTEMQIPV